jgi:enamine deaminase RidA (YjgF/YER057c/UK114 family)
VSTDRVRPPAPRGDYLPAAVHDRVVYTAGMTPRRDGRLIVSGTVGADITPAQARSAARLAAANALAAARSVLPDGASLRCLKMTVYIACLPGFTDLSAVADGASEEIRTALGEQGLGARSAIGVLSLPSGAPVEVELVGAVG